MTSATLFHYYICIILCIDIVLSLRDLAKPIATTHLHLLFGCALPVWTYTAYMRIDTPNIHHLTLTSMRLLPHLGWITVGIGDSMV